MWSGLMIYKSHSQQKKTISYERFHECYYLFYSFIICYHYFVCKIGNLLVDHLFVAFLFHMFFSKSSNKYYGKYVLFTIKGINKGDKTDYGELRAENKLKLATSGRNAMVLAVIIGELVGIRALFVCAGHCGGIHITIIHVNN